MTTICLLSFGIKPQIMSDAVRKIEADKVETRFKRQDKQGYTQVWLLENIHLT